MAVLSFLGINENGQSWFRLFFQLLQPRQTNRRSTASESVSGLNSHSSRSAAMMSSMKPSQPGLAAMAAVQFEMPSCGMR